MFSVNPFAGIGSSGTFTFALADSNGWQLHNVGDVLLNNAIDGISACYFAYVADQQTLLLVDDAGDAGGPYVGYIQFPSAGAPGLGTASNSQCTINGSLSSYSISGQTLTLKLDMTFSAPFAGDRIFYLSAADNIPWNSGWQATASWAVPVQSTAPVITTSSLPNGEVGVAYNHTLQATGGSGTYTWLQVSGTLPAGLARYRQATVN